MSLTEIVHETKETKETLKFKVEGQYFTEWRFNRLKELASLITDRLKDELTFYLHYDSQQDFHHLTFDYHSVKVDIRFYKVFSVRINGKEGWTGCPQYSIYEFAHYIVNFIQAQTVLDQWPVPLIINNTYRLNSVAEKLEKCKFTVVKTDNSITVLNKGGELF